MITRIPASLLLAWLTALTIPFCSSQPQRDPWHHSASKFRASYSYSGAALPGDCGIILEVPVCGLGKPDGRDVVCYDDRGRLILSRALGPGRHNCAVLLCRPEASATRILAYFASGQNAAQANITRWTGVLAELRSLPEGPAENFQQVQSLWEKAPQLALFPVPEFAQVCNPVTSTDRFLLKLRGFSHRPAALQQDWFVAADDSGYLLLNGELQIERPGQNFVYNSLRGEFKKTLSFPAGLSDLELLGVNFSGTFALALGKLPGGNKVNAVTMEDFLPRGQAPRLDKIEAKHRDAANPAFHYRHLSYLSLDDITFTETEIATSSQQEAVFAFADGIRMQGNSIRRIFATLTSCPLTVTVKREEAAGRIDFPEAAPPLRRLHHRDVDYDYFFNLLSGMDFQKVTNQEFLLNCLSFLQQRQLCPEQMPLCEALLKSRRLSPAVERLALTALARAAAQDQPEKARAAFQKLLEMKQERLDRLEALVEALDFALFRLRDYRQAERWLNQYSRSVGRAGERLLTACRFDLALQQGDVATARRFYNALLEGKEYGEGQRVAAVRGNALQERIENLLTDDIPLPKLQLIEAAALLRQFGQLDPGSRGNGRFSLLRARILQKRGWLSGALGELEGAILFEPLLPNLPEIEFARAGVYAQAGNAAKAEELYRKVSSEYPNHPVAEQARRKLP